MWTYQEYMNQPEWLIEFLNEKRGIDAKHIKNLQSNNK